MFFLSPRIKVLRLRYVYCQNLLLKSAMAAITVDFLISKKSLRRAERSRIRSGGCYKNLPSQDTDPIGKFRFCSKQFPSSQLFLL
ncbi:hypothetical protein HanPI659440_Chr05g0195301 [Helianthus annuus]|nr:hypothetical protein HanPI659440_Chr05g0195301 [Helianthus annuus]